MKRYGIYLGILAAVCSFFQVIGYAEDYDGFSHTGKEKKKCALCGEEKGSLRSIYSGSEGVGLLCLSDWRVVPILGPDNGDGDTKCGDMVYQRGGEGAYSIQLERVVDNRISLVEYTAGKRNVPDMKQLSDILCRECMQKVKKAVKIQGEHEGRMEKAVCLVEFPTMELHTIQQNFQYYMLGDYYVQAQCKKKKIKLTVFMV